MRRRDRLELILVLPDGSRSLIPAGWTDLEPPAEQPAAGALASLADLLEARRVLDGVLRRCVLSAEHDGRERSDEEARPAASPGPRGESGPATALWGLLPEAEREAAAALVAKLIARTVAPEEVAGDER
jgi:hypothetical protein